MKKILLSLFLGVSLGLNAQNVNIPDANFKAYLVGNSAINTNGDTEIQVSEANVYSGNISCNGIGISDLTGIEEFVSLGELYVINDNLTSLDLSNNLSLTAVTCVNNQISSLVLPSNSILWSVWCYENNLTSLDVTICPGLEELVCYDNQLTSLDISQNPYLYQFNCGLNQISTIDVSHLQYLTYFGCDYNQLTSIDVSNCSALEQFACSHNQISTLDLSNNPAMTDLLCNDNDLLNLNFANGNNTNVSFFRATANPYLTCIQVDDPTYSTANWSLIDSQTSFNTNCPVAQPCLVNIPDANFKSYLVGNSAINTNGNAEIECTEANNYMGTIDVQGLAISNLTGIEQFLLIDTLIAHSNDLIGVDLTSNTQLRQLDLSGNDLLSIDLSQCVNLIDLNLVDNDLSAVDITNNTMLEEVNVMFNQLNSLDVSNHLSLKSLRFDGNNISMLNVASNLVLSVLTFDNNNVGLIDISQNPLLSILTFRNNVAANIVFGGTTSITRICGENNALTNVDLSAQTLLEQVNLSNNNLSSLNVANGNNVNISIFNTTNNSNLACIQVDDATYSTNNWIDIDANTSFSANCSNTSNIDEHAQSINIYPIPTENYLNIENSLNFSNIQLLDMSGKILYNGQNNVIDMGDFSNGVYLIKIFSDLGTITKKVIKQ